MMNTKQGKLLLDKYPHKMLLAAIQSGPKMVTTVLQFHQVLRIINHPYDTDGNSFVHFAVMLKDQNKAKVFEVIKVLVTHGADPCVINKSGKRPSMLTHNDQVWHYLKKAEIDRDIVTKQGLSETIKELTNQNVSRDSYISKLVSDSQFMETSFAERLRELEISSESMKEELTDEIRHSNHIVDAQRQEIKSLIKEKETLLKTLQLKSEEHITAVYNMQQQQAKETELIKKDLAQLAKNMVELTQGFQQTRNNMIGLQNEAIRSFQIQQATKFNNIQAEITELRQVKNIHEVYHRETKDSIVQLEERQETRYNEFTEDVDTKLLKMRQEEDAKINSLRRDHEDRINVLREDQDSKIVVLKKDHEIHMDGLKHKVDETIDLKEKRDKELFDSISTKLQKLEQIGDMRNENLTTTTKIHSEELLNLHKNITGTTENLDQFKQDTDFKFNETTARYDGSLLKVSKHLKSHENQLKNHEVQITNITNTVEQNRSTAESRATIIEDRIYSVSHDIEITNNKIAENTMKQQQDKQNIYTEIEKDRTALRSQQDKLVEFIQINDTKVTKLTESVHKTTTDVQNHDQRIQKISTRVDHVETTVTETTTHIREDIVASRREDKKKFDTLFERIENNEYYQAEKIHEVVIEKMMDEKKKELEHLESALLNTQHFHQ
jgi:hypothetical protein